jgi:hypothetical protein
MEKTSFIAARKARNTTVKRYGDSTSAPHLAVIDIPAKYITKVKKFGFLSLVYLIDV